jgi:hypothetical protein
MRELFIYYRIPVARAGAALEAALAMQARLRQRHPGLTARLMRRPDEPNDLQTWMEIYAFHLEGHPNGVTPALAAAIATEAAAMAPFIGGVRHTEEFVPCAS